MHADQIVYRELDSPLGEMVAAATAKGCCLLEFRDRGGIDRIRNRILKRYGFDMVKGTDPVLDQLESELNQYFSGSLQTFSVPLDLKGTSFQRAVWSRLLEIPYGQTSSYGEIAALTGRPAAPRAVGRANGDNYVAIIVPCHRVIRSDGGLQGYGGGLWRKKSLLGLEKWNSRSG